MGLTHAQELDEADEHYRALRNGDDAPASSVNRASVLRAELAKEQKERAERVSAALSALLSEERCELRAETFITPDGRIDARIRVEVLD